MFPFDADCSYCGHLLANDKFQGKFYCEKKKEYVSANDHLCSMAIESMGRPNCDKAKLRKISKEHGYYVITVISEVLGLPEDNEYMSAFKYLRDVILPTNDEYKDFIDNYEEEGPILAARIKGDEDARAYVEYLRLSYLNGLVSLFCQNQIDDAIALYTSMLDDIKEKYGYKRRDTIRKEITA